MRKTAYIKMRQFFIFKQPLNKLLKQPWRDGYKKRTLLLKE
jgi:hypothetical protein